MKLEMDKHVEGVLCVASICTCIGAVAYFLAAVWWAGLSDNKKEIAALRAQVELARSETCYTEYAYSEISKVNMPTVSYCTNKEVE